MLIISINSQLKRVKLHATLYGYIFLIRICSSDFKSLLGKKLSLSLNYLAAAWIAQKKKNDVICNTGDAANYLLMKILLPYVKYHPFTK